MPIDANHIAELSADVQATKAAYDRANAHWEQLNKQLEGAGVHCESTRKRWVEARERLMDAVEHGIVKAIA